MNIEGEGEPPCGLEWKPVTSEAVDYGSDGVDSTMERLLVNKCCLKLFRRFTFNLLWKFADEYKVNVDE